MLQKSALISTFVLYTISEQMVKRGLLWFECVLFIIFVSVHVHFHDLHSITFTTGAIMPYL